MGLKTRRGDPEDLLQGGQDRRPRGQALLEVLRRTCSGLKLSKSIYGPKDASGKREELAARGQEDHRRRARSSCAAAEVEEIEITEADLEGAFTVSDIVDPRTGEVILEANEPLNPRVLSVILDPRAQVGALRGLLPRARRDRAHDVGDGQEGHDQDPGRGADRDLPAHAPGRSADPRLLAQPVRGDVPEPAEVRLLARRPPEAQHQARPVARRSARRSCTSRTSRP